MAKLNPYVRRAAESRPVKKLEIQDPFSDDVLTMFVRRLDVPDLNLVNDVTAQAVRKWVSKDNRVDYPWQPMHEDPLPLPPFEYDGEVNLSETTCKSAATALVVQSRVDEDGRPVPESDLYSLDELIAMAYTRQGVWVQLLGQLNNLGMDDDPGND